MFIFLKNMGHQEHEKCVRSEWTNGDNCKNLVKQWLYGHRNRNILMKNLYHLRFGFHLVLSSSFFSAILSYAFKGRFPTSEIGKTGIFLLVSRSFLTFYFLFFFIFFWAHMKSGAMLQTACNKSLLQFILETLKYRFAFLLTVLVLVLATPISPEDALTEFLWQ